MSRSGCASRKPSVDSRRWPGGFARLDAEYILRVRPLLGDAEARVYEALVLKCDGWDGSTSALTIAEITGLHCGTVRRTIQRLEEVGLVRGSWVASRTSPHGQRRFTIVREYDKVVAELRRSEGPGDASVEKLDTRGSQDSQSYDHESCDRTMHPLLIARSAKSNPDPSLPLPDGARAKPVVRRATLTRDGGREAVDEPGASDHHPQRDEGRSREAGTVGPEPVEAATTTIGERYTKATVESCTEHATGRKEDDGANLMSVACPATRTERIASVGAAVSGGGRGEASLNELVILARELWSTDVSQKAAQRYIGQLIGIGEPAATHEELRRYLAWSATTNRVQRARFPIAVACMPEEFSDWLVRYRRMRCIPATRAPRDAPAVGAASDTGQVRTALSGPELVRRAEAFCRRLADRRENGETPSSNAASTSRTEEAEREDRP